MLIAAYVLQITLMVAIPVTAWVVLRRKWQASFRLIGIGAATFVASQVVHIPLLVGMTYGAKALPTPPAQHLAWINAIILGLAAGVCEELARYVALRAWAKSARGFRDAVTFGAGHGGCEALILGLLAGATFVAMLMMRTVDPTKLGVPPASLDKVNEQLHAYWSAPVWLPLLGALERAGAMLVHVAASCLVMLAVVRRRAAPLLLAIGWHALVDGVAVFCAKKWGVTATEAAMVPFYAAAVGIVLAVRPRLEAIRP